MSPARVQMKLRDKGFVRSLTGVSIRMNRQRIRKHIDGLTAHGLSKLLDVDVHAVVVERHARALVVRWHGHLYRVTGEVAEREEGDTGAPRWRVRAFEPWVAAEKRARSRRRAQGGRC